MQLPNFLQNFNRYSYALNNPLKFTDPDGEFFILAAIIGGWIGMGQAMINSDKQGWGLVGDMMKGLLVGGAAGAAGALAGGAIAGTLGTASTLGGSVLNGAITGASGGFAGGFVGGAGNAWAGGASFEQGPGQGFIGGGIGALGGAAFGGAMGGIQHFRSKSIFARIDDGAMVTNSDGSLHASNETLEEFSEKYFGDYKFKDQVRNIYDNELVAAEAGKANAFTSEKLVNGKFNIHYANSAFSSKYQLYLTMGHEYIHVSHFITIGSCNINFSEYASHKWESNVTSYNKAFSNRRLMKAYGYLGTKNITPGLQRKLNPYLRFSDWGIPSGNIPH